MSVAEEKFSFSMSIARKIFSALVLFGLPIALWFLWPRASDYAVEVQLVALAFFCAFAACHVLIYRVVFSSGAVEIRSLLCGTTRVPYGKIKEVKVQRGRRTILIVIPPRKSSGSTRISIPASVVGPVTLVQKLDHPHLRQT